MEDFKLVVVEFENIDVINIFGIFDLPRIEAKKKHRH